MVCIIMPLCLLSERFPSKYFIASRNKKVKTTRIREKWLKNLVLEVERLPIF